MRAKKNILIHYECSFYWKTGTYERKKVHKIKLRLEYLPDCCSAPAQQLMSIRKKNLGNI